MRAKQQSDLIDQIDEWYQRRCDGIWEHRFGVEIVSCDNPGWWMRFTDLPLPAERVTELTETMKSMYGAQLVVRDSTVELFSRSLRTCLSAATDLIEVSRSRNAD
jgi:hypothetical protein